ncbi:MAG TPA: PA0069 family radical SAM protein [Gammaproteobacteria bacterium]|nr:PA0069 family radical SAM protein [Gammaproteobacteria bacterium]
MTDPDAPRKGRGAASNRDSRYHLLRHESFDDGWPPGEEPEPLRTRLERDTSRSIINRVRSPDLPFDRTINPYRGCEHGCIYCYARPSHARLGYSPGLDFESRIVCKPDAAALLREELARPGYVCRPIALGGNTDIYQPVERRLGITRSLLEVLREHCHPLTLVTKSALVLRDVDLLSEMAERALCQVMISVTTLDHGLARRMEPRAAAPARRLEVIRRLAAAGIPVGVLVAPVIPVLTDPEMESVLARAREAGASFAGYTLLRLPGEVAELFPEWLSHHRPGQAAHVMNAIRDTRGGRDSDSAFGRRMRGTGPLADAIAQRFRLAHARSRFVSAPPLDTEAFRVPGSGSQLSLL